MFDGLLDADRASRLHLQALEDPSLPSLATILRNITHALFGVDDECPPGLHPLAGGSNGVTGESMGGALALMSASVYADRLCRLSAVAPHRLSVTLKMARVDAAAAAFHSITARGDDGQTTTTMQCQGALAAEWQELQARLVAGVPFMPTSLHVPLGPPI